MNRWREVWAWLSLTLVAGAGALLGQVVCQAVGVPYSWFGFGVLVIGAAVWGLRAVRRIPRSPAAVAARPGGPAGHPYRGAPRSPRGPRYLPAPSWSPRRLPCLVGAHSMTGVPILGLARHFHLDEYWFAHLLCDCCGAHFVEGRGGADPSTPVREDYRRPFPALACLSCGARHEAPVLHGCAPAYKVADHP